MSTVPGDRSWQDAGLVEPALTDLPEVAPDDDGDVREGGYQPDEPRPDLAGEADPADVAEQTAALPADERDDYP
ncbi:hypothetical protein [Cellulomonas pakistanensis]|uniref:DUF5709 domain-containing protein n=1 Tax=Cellulomonas pakistanensis TaxID=992287 RepID=A0A919U5U2_9CELL|nr:hypothetical protein [Cellulomonas pakistanensis]GIG36369.1 hypothetical protein Cpa01nite_17500 [Cellulomonas pakistanensis]